MLSGGGNLCGICDDRHEWAILLTTTHTRRTSNHKRLYVRNPDHCIPNPLRKRQFFRGQTDAFLTKSGKKAVSVSTRCGHSSIQSSPADLLAARVRCHERLSRCNLALVTS